MKKYDIVFLCITLILLFLGFFIFISASFGTFKGADKNFYYPIVKQLFLGGGGLVLLFAVSKIPYKIWQKLALPFFLCAFILTALVFAPKIGFGHGGAQRWIDLKFTVFQPSELLKFGFIVYLSSWLAKRKNDISSVKGGLLPFLVIVGFMATVLIMQPDIGTLGVICITGLFLFFLSGAKFAHTGFLVILGLSVLTVLIFSRDYMKERVLVFSNPSIEQQGMGYQVNQAKIAFGSGGILGRGFGEGISKYKLPEPASDSVFAVFGEEMGFVGTASLIFLFLLFFYRGFKIALSTRDNFGRLLVAGTVILVVLQSFICMLSLVGFMPLTGLPLVFISLGGSSLIVTLMEIGVILNISKNR